MNPTASPLRLAALAVLCSCGFGAAHADDYPPRKPGLWEISVQPQGAPANRQMGAMQQCTDAATEKMMRDMSTGPGKRDCSKQDVRHEGGKLVVDSICKINGASGPITTATTHSVITGDFNTAYRMESRSTYDPPMMGRSEGAITMDAKWLGPCLAGQKPGDMMMPNGMKMNVFEMGAAPPPKK
jgi:Protein of unknown function (DUF3617)